MEEFDAFVSSVTEQLRSQLRGDKGESAWQSAQARAARCTQQQAHASRARTTRAVCALRCES
jgi:hypothetical protein